MNRAASILAALILSACSGESGPRTPTGPASSQPPTQTPRAPGAASTFLWGMVVDESGVCIPGATVLVVRGQRAGERLAQTTPCGAWDYDGGFLFENLTPGVEMTIRASAPGHADDERTITPSAGPQTVHLFGGARLP